MIEATFKSLRTVVLAAGLVLAGSVFAQGDAAAGKFLTDAIRGSIGEVRLGELAQQRGKSKQVRDFGATLVDDHTSNVQKASALARNLGVTPPTETTADTLNKHEALSKLSGEEFDRAFASHMVQAHQKVIAKYTEQTRDGANPEVAALANEALPTLHEHLETAQALETGSST